MGAVMLDQTNKESPTGTCNSGGTCLKASKTKSKSVARGRQMTGGYNVYSVLLVLTRGCL